MESAHPYSHGQSERTDFSNHKEPVAALALMQGHHYPPVFARQYLSGFVSCQHLATLDSLQVFESSLHQNPIFRLHRMPVANFHDPGTLLNTFFHSFRQGALIRNFPGLDASIHNERFTQRQLLRIYSGRRAVQAPGGAPHSSDRKSWVLRWIAAAEMG